MNSGMSLEEKTEQTLRELDQAVTVLDRGLNVLDGKIPDKSYRRKEQDREKADHLRRLLQEAKTGTEVQTVMREAVLFLDYWKRTDQQKITQELIDMEDMDREQLLQLAHNRLHEIEKLQEQKQRLKRKRRYASR